ncbi:hypothetical protein [Clostridium sp.]|uniref:hypothetical protein n=1 Tax=Clostridium sp. TaxID=1506 RepID=UPI002633FC14|nr:hypothetical protein [Clostridium sp.]
MIKKVKKLVVIVLLFMVILLPANIAYARAGGGHGGGHGGSYGSSGSSGGSDFKIFDFLFLGGFTSLMAYGLVSLRKEKRKYKEELDEIGKSDSNWEFDNINLMIEETFYKVQKAWKNDKYEEVLNLLTDELYTEHTNLLEDMRNKNRRNILKNIKFGYGIIQSYFKGNEEFEGFLWVKINFSMKDYIIELRGNKKVVVEGSKSIEDGNEYWKFVYRNNKWLLAEILQNEPQYNSEYFKKEVRRVEHKINNKKNKLK